jgi:hypothetical protein
MFCELCALVEHQASFGSKHGRHCLLEQEDRTMQRQEVKLDFLIASSIMATDLAAVKFRSMVSTPVQSIADFVKAWFVPCDVVGTFPKDIWLCPQQARRSLTKFGPPNRQYSVAKRDELTQYLQRFVLDKPSNWRQKLGERRVQFLRSIGVDDAIDLGESHLCTSKVPCVFVELANLNEKVLIEYLMKRHDTTERRLAGEPFPWTADVRLQAGRYMNIHRRLDPTSIFLANVLEGLPFPLRLLNAALFRMVGTIDFWRECVINPIQQWADELWDGILQRVLLRVASGWNPFTRAYNHPRHSQGATEGNVIEVFKNLHTALSQLWKKMDAIEASFFARRSWEDLHKALVKNVHFMGAFYAKEVCLDGLEESMDVVDLHTWSPVCTGGRKGLNICFQRPREWGVRFRSAAAVRLWEQECRVVQARMLYIYTYIHLYIYIYYVYIYI